MAYKFLKPGQEPREGEYTLGPVIHIVEYERLRKKGFFLKPIAWVVDNEDGEEEASS
ncbi:MAG: hypothetical protein ACRD2L_01470 [Terriglobia bacterium]